jgi:limonene-1,2-epoxide hydrolase
MDARTFIDALHALEDRGELEPMVALFADDADLRNPSHVGPHRGPDGARRFWSAYRGTFRDIHSEFRHVLEDGGSALLEWTSRGRTTGGLDVAYDGVTVLEWEGDRLRRFRAYFDPGDLTAAASTRPAP